MIRTVPIGEAGITVHSIKPTFFSSGKIRAILKPEGFWGWFLTIGPTTSELEITY